MNSVTAAAAWIRAVVCKPLPATALTVVVILAAAIAVRDHREKQVVRDAPVAVVTPAVKPGVATQQRADRKPAAAAVDTTKAAPAKAAGGEGASVSLLITPWGEVYIDGKKNGVSPPLRDVRIAAGKHRIEVRNTNFQSHVEMIDVKAGERITIRHKFN
jgi:serine/threonine-protein kinase